MKQYFKQFEERLQVAEEKLDILSDWHIAKGHKGATEIAEECRKAIISLWTEFYRLSEAYLQAEVSHEEFYQANINNLLGELKEYDNECMASYKKAHEWLLFNFLDKAIKENNLSNGIINTTASTWHYLRSLVIKDLRERGLL
ncbi:hypothetical protein [Streptococcus suis]|uniref:hypothetical protein n=1 Tax=Streptococcus suis TaxID=1307 RepID=UPI00040BD8BB|nr:hypothetical protein [Streptococcus suis]NQH20986.1 hypothetical protein [Streptococcus suis]CYU94601.1 Uncharacterised protein [Streptococcus suis]HEM2745388.1 hypothetical protein [Streptococcus suis]HEM2799189.1 hypothetical protein [Streptococcus suis]HEM3209323.1 hypothetical protein [Streptococcus suis 22083]